MRRVPAALLLGVALACAQPAIDPPVVGYFRNARSLARPVHGVAGSFVLGPPLDFTVLAATSSGLATVVKTPDRLLQIDGRGRIVRRWAAEGTALLAFSEDGSSALAWLPATSQLLLWSEAPPPRRGTRLLSIDPLQIAGAVVSTGFLAGRRPAFLIQRDAGMWLAQLSPSGAFEREEPLAGVASPALLLPAGGILYGAGRELVLMAANGSERRLAVGGAVSSLAAMGDGWIHVALAGGDHYALRLANSELALYRIPKAAP